jgi:hypothetical protein
MRLFPVLVCVAFGLTLAGEPAHAKGKGKGRGKAATATAAKKTTGARKKAATRAKPVVRGTTRAKPWAKETDVGRGKRANLPAGWTWPPSQEMIAAGERCLRDLERLGVEFEEAEPDEGRITTPVVVPSMTFGGVTLVSRYRKPPFYMDCRLARALARDVAPALRNMHVRAMRFGQILDVRDVAGRPGVLSRHALGMAMDVYAFETDDGVVHLVEGGYKSGDEVLLEAERRVTDTGAFRALLTPGNDPGPHHDHYHFEVRAEGDKVWTGPTRAKPVDDVVIDVAAAVAPAKPATRKGSPAPAKKK